MAKSRRSDYRGRRRRRRGGGFFATLLTACIIVGALVASVTVFLKVADFEVVGAKTYEPAKIIAASGIQIGDNLFSVNKFDVARNILGEFPYIGAVNIRRRFPDTFVFEITERKQAAFIQAEKLRWLIDKDGYILESIPADQQVALPAVAGATMLAPSPGTRIAFKEEDSLRVLSQVLSAIESGGIVNKIGKVDVSKLYNLTITYENRFVVVLGTEEDLDKKIRMLKAVVEQLEATDRGTINLSDVKQARFQPNANIQMG